MIYIVLCLTIVFKETVGVSFTDFNSCCNVCQGNKGLWVSFHDQGLWKLTVEGDTVHDFLTPLAMYNGEETATQVEFYNRRYTLKYAGVPILIRETNVSEVVLEEQYIQLDLITTSYITGINIQGGYYQDAENDLFEDHYTWPSKLAISYSTGSKTFTWMRDSDGDIQIYDGLDTQVQYKILDVGDILTAQLIRIHPLEAYDQNGQTNLLMLRVGAITCSDDPLCAEPYFPCVLNEWQEWNLCECSWAGCKQSRNRSVVQNPACGAELCDGTWEQQSCIPPEPVWKLSLKIIGAFLPIALILSIAASCFYKKCNKQPEVAFKQLRKRQPKEKTERKLRSDLAFSGTFEDKEDDIDEINDDEEETSDFLEDKLIPKSIGLDLKKSKLETVTEIDVLDSDSMDGESEEIPSVSGRLPISMFSEKNENYSQHQGLTLTKALKIKEQFERAAESPIPGNTTQAVIEQPPGFVNKTEELKPVPSSINKKKKKKNKKRKNSSSELLMLAPLGGNKPPILAGNKPPPLKPLQTPGLSPTPPLNINIKVNVNTSASESRKSSIAGKDQPPSYDQVWEL